MTPLAIEGTAPIRMTNRIASSDIWNSRIARGNQAIEGIVCSPVIREPMAARRILDRATSMPSTSPSTQAMAKPTMPRVIVTPTAFQNSPFATWFPSSTKTGNGPGRT
jgi:hypothetical protein